MKLTKNQIKLIKKQTDRTLVGQHKTIYEVLGYFQPANANWAYIAGWTCDHELVVTQFGEVLG